MPRRSDAELKAAYLEKVAEINAREDEREKARHQRLTADVKKFEDQVQNLTAKKNKDNETIDRRIRKAEANLADAIAQLDELVGKSDDGQDAG